MLIQKLHPALRLGQRLTLVSSGAPLFSRQGHWDGGSALHGVAMALAMLGKLSNPVDVRCQSTGPESDFWDQAWPHYLHGLTLSELASFIAELKAGVRPVTQRGGSATILCFCEQELARDVPIIIGWQDKSSRQRRTALVIGIEGRQHRRIFAPHALLLLDPAGGESGLAACNARLEFGKARSTLHVTATAIHQVTVKGAVSIRLLKSKP